MEKEKEHKVFAIKPYEGVLPINFGIGKPEIVKIFESHEFKKDEIRNIEWIDYFSLQLSYDKDDLCQIITFHDYNPNSSTILNFQGQNLYEMNTPRILQFLKEIDNDLSYHGDIEMIFVLSKKFGLSITIYFDWDKSIDENEYEFRENWSEITIFSEKGFKEIEKYINASTKSGKLQ